MEEATPRLGFNFEEIDFMGDLLLTAPSALLDRAGASVVALAGGREAVARESRCHDVPPTQVATFEELAE
jgi:hypothetical protein